MVNSINDEYRKRINSMKNEKEVLKYISSLKKKELEYIIGLIISDLYKMIFFTYPITKENGLKAFIEGKIDYTSFSDEQFVLLLEDGISATNDFYELSLLNKIVMFEDLERNKKYEILENINNYSFLDKLSFSFRYDLDFLVELYYDSIKKEHNKKVVLDYIMYKFDDLKVINDRKFEQFCLEFLRTYYKCKLYSKEKNKYLDIIESQPIVNLLVNVEANEKFMSEILKNYFEYQLTDNKQRKQIDEYFNLNKKESIQKKLKF